MRANLSPGRTNTLKEATEERSKREPLGPTSKRFAPQKGEGITKRRLRAGCRDQHATALYAALF